MSAAAQITWDDEIPTKKSPSQQSPQIKWDDESQTGWVPDADASGWIPDGAPPAQPKAGVLSTASEVAFGTRNPLAQLRSEYQQLKTNPVQTLEGAAKTAAMAPVNLAYNLIHHPIDTVTRATGGPQFAEGWESKNVPEMAGAVLGGLANSLPIMMAPGADEAAVAKIGDLGSGLSNLGDKAGTALRTEKGAVRPGIKAVSRVAGGALGHATGIPYADVAGYLTGPHIADLLIPDRPVPPALLEAGTSRISPQGSLGNLPGVSVVPEPRTRFPGEDPNYMASVPRGRLPGLAAAGKPGAGAQLQQLGKTVLYVPPEGYPEPRIRVNADDLLK